MGWIESSGVRLYAERRGSGQPLLYISGTGRDLRTRPNAFDIPELAPFDLVSYDQRGLGRSGQPDGPYSMADYGEDAAAALDWARWPSGRVLGVSFGGMVAQELLVRHPDRVSRAVLACTSSGGAGGSSYPLHELARLPRDERVRRTLSLLDSRWDDRGAPVAVSLPGDDLRAATLVSLLAQPPLDRGSELQLEARRRHDVFARLSSIACPVLVCAGRFDAIAPVANAEAIAAQIPNSELALFEGGHLFMVQDPLAMDRIGTFLGRD